MNTIGGVVERWEFERSARRRREQRILFAGSIAAHVALAAALMAAPNFAPSIPLPPVVTVDLVAAAPMPAAPAPAPAPRAPAPPPPEAPAVAPPPVAPKKVLPREPAPAERKSKAKPKPRPRPKRPEKELAYDDALAALRNELGENAPNEAEQALDAAPAPSGPGRVDPELARWQSAVQVAIARTWVAPAEYRNTALRTHLVVTVMADGTVLGAPAVKRSSGDPYFDDNAVRAVLQASPLPPPPRSGDWPILFDPTE